MADQLPIELIGEILHRIPAESLIRFKAMSKKWNGLISREKSFMYKHLGKSPERFLRIDNNESVQIMDPVTGSLSVRPIPVVFRRNNISYMVHCDGLMLCLCQRRRDCAINLAVWNPVLREIKWIEPLVRYWSSDYFGIGYNKNTPRGTYKILRFWRSPLLSYREDDKSDTKFEIYEFNSDSWKVLGASFDGEVDRDCKGVSLKGNMYWITKYNNQGFILSFDFSSETFNNICVCPPSSLGTRALACFNGDGLSLLQQYYGESTEIEVWLTNKLSDGVVSFSKHFSVTSPDLPVLHFHNYMARPGFTVGKHRNIMVWCEGDEREDDDQWCLCIKFYEIDEGGIRNQFETGRHGHGHRDYRDPFVCSYVYVPSLISIPVQKK